MKPRPIVSIIFPNYNGGKEPLECLESISKLDYPKNKIEIIVIDNNSTDGSAKKISNFKFQISNFKVIKNIKNLGFAKAINQGIKKSIGEYIFIGNDDILFGEKSLRIMIDYMTKHKKIGVLGGKIFSKKNKKQVVSNGYMFDKWTGNIYKSHYEDQIHEPDWIQGCGMLVPQSVIQKVGLLDEGFSLSYFEDVDYCFRVKKAGYKVTYLPTALFWHGQSTTSNKYVSVKLNQWHRNKIRFVLKNLSFIHAISILTIQTLLVTPYKLLILRDKQFFPFLNGLLWNITHLSKTIRSRNDNYSI